jgi:predicted phosphohydrolase
MGDNKEYYLWFTDVHFDYAGELNLFKFIDTVNQFAPKGVFITGDIANGISIENDLKYISRNCKTNIYFVLGNHDRYFSSFKKVKQKIKRLCKKYKNLFWMPEAGVVELNDKNALIGVDGWFNFSYTKPKNILFTNDWFMIKELLVNYSVKSKMQFINKIIDDGCKIIKSNLETALEKYEHIHMLTHFPPFIEASGNEKLFFKDFWNSYDVNTKLGNLLKDIMKNYPDKKLTVYCGHTHKWKRVEVASNMECIVGDSRYFNPSFSKTILEI